MNTEMIDSIDLSVDDKKGIASRIAAANELLKEKSETNGFGSVRFMRQEYCRISKHSRGRSMMIFDQETKNAFSELVSLESLALSGFGRMVRQLASSFYLTYKSTRPHLDECDYVQEASWAVFDAVHCYDGSTQMSTYFYASVKRRLAGFVRSEEIHSGIGRPTKVIRAKIREIMRDKMCNLDAAFVALRKVEDISEEMEDMVRSACYNVKYASQEMSDSSRKDIFDSMPAKHVEPMSEEVELLIKAVGVANFTPIQREMIEYFLKNGKRIDMELVRGRINPNTNKPYTRQGVGQQWQRACNKLRALMTNQPQPEESEELAEAA